MAVMFALLATLAFAVAIVYEDDFTEYNSSFWQQSTDIEHCEAGGCIEARIDHLQYGQNGLTNLLDRSPCNTTGCCQNSTCALWAAGHLRTQASYLYGNYTWLARAAHAPGAAVGTGACPNNTFSCLSASYVSQPIHNEVTLCFNPTRPSTVDFAYWFNATMNLHIVALPFNPHLDTHEYAITWAPDALIFSVDGTVQVSVHGIAGSTIPFIAGQGVLIARPLTTLYEGDAVLTVRKFTFAQ